jgi:hypothetical protein
MTDSIQDNVMLPAPISHYTKSTREHTRARTGELARYCLYPTYKDRVWGKDGARNVRDLWKELCNPKTPGWYGKLFHRRLPDKQAEDAMMKLETFLDREPVSEGIPYVERWFQCITNLSCLKQSQRLGKQK